MLNKSLSSFAMTVSDLNLYIKNMFANDKIMTDVWVTGEISNFKHHSSGHMYLTLKDQKCAVKAVMFRQSAMRMRFLPKDGLKVIVRGYISVYERDGAYQIYIQEIQPEGLGALYLAFEQLKKKLSDEGLFDRQYKKPIPLLPCAVGVVTSQTGAVIRDIINVSTRRFPNATIRLIPASVQGAGSELQIAKAIRVFNKLGNVDVIIVGRGGGSLEDLQPFNNEIVARAVFESAIPVISAVGHETDETITDYVADLRAPTPSAAAEMTYPDKYTLENLNRDHVQRLRNAAYRLFENSQARYLRILGSSVLKRPYDRVYQERERLDNTVRRLTTEGSNRLQKVNMEFEALAGRLDSLSPLAVLSRGYSVAMDAGTKKVIKSAADSYTGQMINIRLQDSELECKVLKIIGGNSIE